jgi:hypothetical protein
MKTSVSESIAQMMPLIDPKGYTTEQFCNAVNDKPMFSNGGSEDLAALWLELAKEGRLAVFRYGTEDAKTGEFKAFDIPWVYDAREESVGYSSIEMLSTKFPNEGMKPRHWGVTAERAMEAGEFPGLILSEVLYRWADAAYKGKLCVEFEKVVPENPYDTLVRVTVSE